MAVKKDKPRLPRIAIRVAGRVRPPAEDPRSEHDRLVRALADLELSRSRYVDLYDSAPVGYVTLSRNGIIDQINLRGAQMLGHQRNQLVGNPLLMFIASAERRKFLKFLCDVRRLGGYRSVELELRCRRGDNPVFIELIASAPEGQFVGQFQTALVDITPRRRAEAELKLTRDELERAGRAKDDFLAALSHELRTPLNPVLLLASEAARNRDLPPQVRADFDAIRRNIELEAHLIDDLLDLTRVSRGKLVLDRRDTDVHAVLADAISKVQREVDRKRIALEVKLGAGRPEMSADPVRLQQVFWNVLKNAVKFTPEGGRITVETEYPADDRLAIRVRDTGIGMSPAEIGQAFGAFSQGKHELGGLGLGLAISRALVEMHSGSIRAESPGKGQGSVFTIELPLHRAAPQVAPAASPAPTAMKPVEAAAHPAERIHVLLVEDHEPTRSALEKVLARRGCKVAGAASLAEAHALVERPGEKFRLLICDVGLPDGNGCSLMEELRTRGVRGIALTGYGTEKDIFRSRSAGFAVHLTKPVDIEALDKALAEALKD